VNPSQLFLPFVPSGRSIELQAIEVKQRLRLGPYASLDPEAVLERLPARLLGETDFPGLSGAASAALFGPGGEVLVRVERSVRLDLDDLPQRESTLSL
jgi:hypothetical protein